MRKQSVGVETWTESSLIVWLRVAGRVSVCLAAGAEKRRRVSAAKRHFNTEKLVTRSNICLSDDKQTIIQKAFSETSAPPAWDDKNVQESEKQTELF